MRTFTCSLLLAALTSISALSASFREDQITAQELAQELDFNTRKLVFTFEGPVYAQADFVRVDSGHAVHSPIPTATASSETPFYYILRNSEPGMKSVTFKIGNSTTMRTKFKSVSNPSARVHDAYPEIVLPGKPNAQKPIFVFLNWDPDIDRDLSRNLPPEEIAGKMKQGYYLALYFSDTPFTKP